MSRLDVYWLLFEHEADANLKMVEMLESVPHDKRTDGRFLRALEIADHIVTCRENWLGWMENRADAAWRPGNPDLMTLRGRLESVASQWRAFLANLDPGRIQELFEFEDSGHRFQLPTEVQIAQLAGHGAYHRGQVALLVDQLGGETVDTDFVDWWWTHRREPAV